MSCQSAGIELFYTENFLCFEIIGQGGSRSVIAGETLVFLYQKGRHLNSVRLDIFGIDAVVAYQRIGHGHHLAAVRRIGENLLVSGHAGIEHHFTPGFTGPGKAFAGKGSSVFQG